MDQFVPKLDGKTEFLLKGDGSDDPYHQWVLAYYLKTSKSGRYFGLEVVDFGDPEDGWGDDEEELEDEEAGEDDDGEEVDDDGDALSELSVVLEDPEATDKRKIAALLIKTYEAASGKFIDCVHERGELLEEPKPKKRRWKARK